MNTVRPIPTFTRALAATTLALACVSCDSGPFTSHVLRVNGIRLYYQVHGSGPPLVLLHGGGGSGEQFARQIPDFEKHFRLIVPDLRGQGRSTDGAGPLTYRQMADDVTALLDHLKIRRADVMGWSDGGIVGLDLAIRRPERIGHLVTFGANFTPDGYTPEALEWITKASAESFGASERAEYARHAPDPDHFEIAMNKILAMWRAQPNFTKVQLRGIRAKTLVAAGEHDMVRADHTELLARAIPGAQLWIVPGATHAAILERPDLVNPRVLAFLEDRPAQ